eukprot:g2804.t1
MASFSTPTVYINRAGWGPTELPRKFMDVPYIPFGKGDRLGKAADFTQRWRNHRMGGRDYPMGGKDGDGSDDEDDFALVDSAEYKKPQLRMQKYVPYRRRRNNRYNKRGDPRNEKGGRGKKVAQSKRSKLQSRRWQSSRHRYTEKKTREASVKVESDWRVIEQFDQAALAKLTMPASSGIPEGKDLGFFGHLEYYDDSFDRISTKQNKRLERINNRTHFYVGTSDDPVIGELASQSVGNVFATDALLAVLMTSPRSVFSWDIVVRRIGEKGIILDKREESKIDYHTVNETVNSPPDDDEPESINSQNNLSMEATMINQNFSQQILRRKEKKADAVVKEFDNGNPFFDEDDVEEGMEPAAVCYRYRQWELGNDIKLTARTEIHGIHSRKGKDHYMTSFSLNEWDSKLAGSVNWRSKIDSQRGAVLATELKNNTFKVARWTAQTLLSGSDQMCIGYISRTNSKDNCDHQILATQFYKPKEFSMQINLSTSNMWAILKHLIEACLKQPEGKYILMKDPMKSEIMLYGVPDNYGEDSDGADDSSDDSDDSDSDDSGDEAKDGTTPEKEEDA